MSRICFYFALTLLLFLSACANAPEPTEAAVRESTPQPPPMPEQKPVLPEASEKAAEGASPAASPAAQEIPAYNNYNVSLEIEPVTRAVRGIERIGFTNHTGAALESVVLRVYLNAFGENFEPLPYFPSRDESMIYRSGKDYGYMRILNATVESGDTVYALEGTVLTVTLPEPLPPEQTVQLGLQFEAYVPKIAHRTGANDAAMWCGMFLPVVAAYEKDGANPGWRTEPYYPVGEPFVLETANYTVAITTPPEYVVAGTGVKTEDVYEDKKVTTFNAKMTRDFAFAVSDSFKIAETRTESGVTVQFYYYTENANVDGVLNAAKRGMDYFEKTVGTYPFPGGHICIVETDMFVSGVEFSKVIFMDSERLKLSQDFYNLIHSVGHQWFFNVVGNDQIKNPWLDEAMVLYIQERIGNPPEADFLTKMNGEYESFIVSGNQALINDAGSYKSRDDYYTVQCAKGKLMLFALNQLMGDEKFSLCLQQYYQTYSFRVASVPDFIAAAERVYAADEQSARDEIAAFFDEWLNGEGLPEIAR